MNPIDNDNLQKLVIWAEQNEDKDTFLKVSQEASSYFMVRETEENYIMEYSFKTLEELKRGLEEYSGLFDDQQLLREMTVQICQNRFKSHLSMTVENEHIGSNQKTTEKTLPDFVYVF